MNHTPAPTTPLALQEYVLLQGGQQFRCSSIVFTPASRTLMTDLNPEGTSLNPSLIPAFITATIDRPINTMGAVHLLAGDHSQTPLSFLRSQSSKVVTDRIRIDEPDATRAARLWQLT